MADRIPAHGTPGRYQGPRRHNRWQPCRCPKCRAAAMRAAKGQELRRLRGIPAYVDRAAVAAHVQTLLDARWTKHQIADASGISRKTVWNVLHGDRSAVQLATAQALLALKPLERPDGMVPALGAMRRLHALAAMGWTLAWAGEQVGLSYTAVRDISAGRTKSVHEEHFAAIERVFRAHAMKPGPSSSVRNAARSKKWATATAWDDIDDPACRPDFGADDPMDRTAIAAYRRAEIEHLSTFNLPEGEIANRLGLARNYVHDLIRNMGKAA